jgi:hypothetical protein
MTELDTETQAAIEALVHRLKNREDGTDDEPFAMEFIQAMIGRGWRPTEARRSKPWTAPRDGDSPQPQASKPGGAEYFEFRQHLDELAAQAERRRTGAA